jgi:hypothetical protein
MEIIQQYNVDRTVMVQEISGGGKSMRLLFMASVESISAVQVTSHLLTENVKYNSVQKVSDFIFSCGT